MAPGSSRWMPKLYCQVWGVRLVSGSKLMPLPVKVPAPGPAGVAMPTGKGLVRE